MNRKEAILKAAAELFAARGFDATPTAEVAKAAGVAEGTIFHHFKTKDGLLIHIFEELMSSYLKEAHVQIDEADTGMDAVERFIRFHFRFISEFAKESLVISRDIPAHFFKPDFPHRKLVDNHVSQIVRLLEASIERGQKDGSIRDVVVDKTAFILRGLLIGLTRQRLLGPIDLPDLSEEAVDFCHQSLACRI